MSFIPNILNIYYKILRATVEFDADGFEAILDDLRDGRSAVVLCPHTVLLPAIVFLFGQPATFLASRSGDGALVSHVLEKAGFSVVRGSSSRGAVSGLAGVTKALKPGRMVGLTFDGPKGPPLEPKKGMFLLSRRATGGTYLLFFRMQPRFFRWIPSAVRLRSWDRFHLLLPFARVKVEVVELFRVGGRLDPDQLARRVQLESEAVYGELYLDRKKS